MLLGDRQVEVRLACFIKWIIKTKKDGVYVINKVFVFKMRYNEKNMKRKKRGELILCYKDMKQKKNILEKLKK